MKIEEKFSGKYLSKSFIIKKLVKNYFNNIDDIISNLDVEKVLEVGCGLGFSTEYLSRMFENKKFQASEFNDRLLKKAKKKNPCVKIIQESVYDLKREDNSFDLIMVLEVLEHLKKPELALEEIHRATNRYCLISVPNEPLWRFLNVIRLKYLKRLGNTPDHYQHWSEKTLVRFLEPLFLVKKIKKPLPWIFILGEKRNFKI